MTALNFDTPFLYFISLIVVFVFLFFSLILIIFSLFFKASTKKLHKENQLVKEEAYQKALAILEEAQKKSLEIIGNADDHAKYAIDQINNFSVAAKSMLEEEVKNVSQKELNEIQNVSATVINTYKQDLEKEASATLKVLDSVAKNVETALNSQVKTFEDTLRQETVDSEKIVTLKLAEEYEKIDKELVQYREAKIKKIDENIYLIVNKMVKGILKKSIRLEDQHDMILNLLNESKKDGEI